MDKNLLTTKEIILEKKKHELINLYLSHNNNPSKFSKAELDTAINLLSEIKFFKELRNKIGYYNMKSICLILKITSLPAGSRVNERYTIHLHYFHPLIGKYSLVRNSQTKLGRYQVNEKICETQCTFVEFETNQFMQIIQNNFNEQIKHFANTITFYPPFTKLLKGEIEKMFLNYDIKHYRKGEYAFKEEDNVDGFYLIVRGEFTVKKEIKESMTSQLEQLEKDVIQLKKENEFYSYCVNHKCDINSYAASRIKKQLKIKNLTQNDPNSLDFNRNALSNTELGMKGNNENDSLHVS